jgi:hypothetical protein
MHTNQSPVELSVGRIVRWVNDEIVVSHGLPALYLPFNSLLLFAFNNDECIRISLSYPCRFKRRGTILAAIAGDAGIVYVLKPAFRSVTTTAKEEFSLCLFCHWPSLLAMLTLNFGDGLL